MFDTPQTAATSTQGSVAGLDPLSLLKKLLPAADCDCGIPAIFMSGYLCDTHAFSVGPEQFDSVGQTFCRDAGVSTKVWEQMLSSLIRVRFKDAADEKECQDYMVKAVAEYMKYSGPTTAPVAEPVDLTPLTVEIPSFKDLGPAHQLLSSFKDREIAVKDVAIGGIITSWTLAGVPEANQVAEIQLVKANGSVVLIGYIRDQSTGRILASSAPAYSVFDVIPISLKQRTVNLRLVDRST